MIRKLPFGVATVLTVAISISTLTFSVARASGESGAPEPPAIRITPPAPSFDNAKRLDELAARRKHVAEAIGPKAILVLFSADPRVYANDVDYPFRQENNLFYLTNLNHKRATLVLMPGNLSLPEVLFLPRRSPAAETWTGHMYSPQDAAELSGIKEIWETSEFEPFINALRKHEVYRPINPANILLSKRTSSANNTSASDSLIDAALKNEGAVYLLANFPREGESHEYRQEQRFAATWSKDTGFAI